MENNLTPTNKAKDAEFFERLKETTYKGTSREEAFNKYKKKHPNVLVDFSNMISTDEFFKDNSYILFGSKRIIHNSKGFIYNEVYRIRKVYFKGTDFTNDSASFQEVPSFIRKTTPPKGGSIVPSRSDLHHYCFETEYGESINISPMEIARGFISVYPYEEVDYVCK